VLVDGLGVLLEDEEVDVVLLVVLDELETAAPSISNRSE
jgi:hypothetical protein